MRKRSNRKEMETEVKREQKCSERKTGRERGGECETKEEGS